MKEKIYRETKNKLYHISNVIAIGFTIGGIITQVIGFMRGYGELREMAAYVTLLSAGYIIGITSSRKIFKEIKKRKVKHL